MSLVGATAFIRFSSVESAFADEPARSGEQQRAAETETASAFTEIIVTARKREESLSELPAAAVAFTGATLEEQGISNLQQLGTLYPSLYITATIFIDSFFLRGVGSSPNDPGFEQQMGLFVDGIYHGNGRWISSATFDAALVQVLAGPQGVYFGKNTIAGAIDITTRDPGAAFEAVLKAGYEFEARERYGEVVISGPLSSTFGARLSGRVSRMSGWATNDLTDAREPGASDAVGRLTFKWAPTNQFESNLKLQVQNFNDNGPTARTVLLNCSGPGNTPAPLTLQGFPIWGPTSGDASCKRDFDIHGPRQLREGRANSHVPAHTSVLALHWRPGIGELTSITGYNHYTFNAYQSLNASSLNQVESREESQNDAVSTELRYQTQLLRPVNFMVGGYYQSSSYEHDFAAGVFPPSFQGAGNTFEQRSSTDADTQSYFLELLWNIAAAWELDVGYRYTRERKSSTFNTLSVAPNVAAFFGAMHFTTEQQFTHSAPQASLTWRPTRDFTAYAAYKTGFLSGGFAHAQVPTPFTRIQDFLFGEETARGGEVGTKLAVANGRLHFDLVSYYYDYDGLQVSTFQPASLSFAVQNAGKSRSKGVELRGLWQVTNELSLDSAITHGSTKYTRYIGACLPNATFATGCSVPLPGGAFAQDFKGFRTSFAPDWTARVGLEYRKALTPALSLSFGAGVSYSDSYIVGDVFYQPAWTKYDGRIALSSSAWQAALIANNLSNEAICSQAASRPLGGSGETVCWLDRAREVRFELSVQL